MYSCLVDGDEENSLQKVKIYKKCEVSNCIIHTKYVNILMESK